MSSRHDDVSVDSNSELKSTEHGNAETEIEFRIFCFANTYRGRRKIRGRDD